MDRRLQWILESLLLNVDTLNSEIERLDRNEQFTPTGQGAQLIGHIRLSCRACLHNLRLVERRLYKNMPLSPTQPPSATMLCMPPPGGE